MMRKILAALAVAFAAGSSNPAAAELISFNPGTYHLSQTNFGQPVDTLVVTLSGGFANFVLSGADNATFRVPNLVSPTMSTQGSNPVFYIPGSSITASWNTAMFPFLTFWLTSSEGGVTAGSIPGNFGNNYFDTYQSTSGTGQVFTILNNIPEPMTLVLFGGGLAGAAVVRRRRKAAAQA